MVFQARDVSIQRVRGYGKRNTFKSRRDLTVFVLGYDLENGVMDAISTQDGRRMYISVDPAYVSRGREQEKKYSGNSQNFPFLGYSIDAKMKESIPPGKEHIAVIEGAEVTRKINNTIDGEKTEIRMVTCRKISNGGNDKKKVFETIISLSYNERFNTVDRVQSWNTDAISSTDEDGINSLAAKFDRFAKAHEDAQLNVEQTKSGTSYLPTLGAEIRTIKLSDNPTETGKIIDLSGRMERTKASYDPETNVIVSTSKPINGTIFKSNLKEYIQYIKSTYGEDVMIEVASYTSYPTGKYRQKDMDFDKMEGTFSPFLQLATARSRLSDDDESYVEGGNYGCWGVLSISKDRVDNDDSVTRLHYANKVYISSNSKAFVHRKIKGANSQLFDLDPSLKGEVLKYSDSSSSEKKTFDTSPSSNEYDIPFSELSKTPPTSNFSKHNPASTSSDPVADAWDDDIPFDRDDTNTVDSIGNRRRSPK